MHFSLPPLTSQSESLQEIIKVKVFRHVCRLMPEAVSESANHGMGFCPFDVAENLIQLHHHSQPCVDSRVTFLLLPW